VIILEEPIKSVQILLDTDRIYGKAYGDEIVGELSKTLNIPRDKIHILTAFRGSLGLVIFMPSSAAHKLYILSSQRDQSLLDIRMIKCELENCLPITLKISSQDSDIQLAVYQNNLGNVYLAEGNAKKALPIFSKSFKILQRINTQESLLILSETLQSLGRAFVSLSNTQLAIKYFEQSLTLNFELFGTNHYTSADILEQLGKIQETLGKYDTSVAIFQNVLEIRESAFETIHPKILNSLYRIGSIHFQTLNHSKAKEYFQRIIMLSSTVEYLYNRIHSVNTLKYLGKSYLYLLNDQNALQVQEIVLTLQKSLWPLENPSTLEIFNDNIDIFLNEIGESYVQKYYTELLNIEIDYLDFRVPITNCVYGRILCNIGKTEDAVRHLLKAETLEKEKPLPDMVLLSRYYYYLGEIYFRILDYESSSKNLAYALEIQNNLATIALP
jgi:tetratricopeptide (TPR) repeat protein